MKCVLFLILIVCSCSLWAGIFDETRDIPVVYKGRFRPLDPASRLWLYDFHHREKINGLSSLDFLWKIHFLGHRDWDDVPLFWIQRAEVKELLGLDNKQSHFSFHEIQKNAFEDPEINLRLMQKLIGHSFIKSYIDPENRGNNEKLELTALAQGLWVQLKGENLTIAAAPTSPPWHFLTQGMVLIPFFKSQLNHRSRDQLLVDDTLGLLHLMDEYALHKGSEIPNEALDRNLPLAVRLKQAGTSIMALPGKFSEGEWFSLKALKIKVLDADKKQFVPVSNFTLFPDERFEKIRSAYLAIETALMQKSPDAKVLQDQIGQLTQELKEGYSSLAGIVYKEAAGKKLSYPLIDRLRIEQIYYDYPWIQLCIICYGLAVCFFILKPLRYAALSCMAFAFLLHTCIMAMRCYILQRPPVSNMFETVVYVPWIAVLASLALAYRFKSYLVLAASSTAALALLVLLKLTAISSSLENVQAVLDSQYWLIIHVLMVVGSYGAFILSGILGHFYLAGFVRSKVETESLSFLAALILQSMYLGVALLVPGTLLGGVWAAESWGRFWDWDPKESWAFISACIYLVFIHAYTFKHIRNFGLAIGSIAGLLAVSFTWYGVNYILGTGLHTYGFGSGGEIYYYLYFSMEVLFLFIVFSIWLLTLRKVVEKNRKNAI